VSYALADRSEARSGHRVGGNRVLRRFFPATQFVITRDRGAIHEPLEVRIVARDAVEHAQVVPDRHVIRVPLVVVGAGFLAEAIDLVTRYALGVRLAMIGPLLQRDLNGLDTHLNIARYLYADLDARDTPPETLARMVAAGDIGRKSGQGFYTWDAEQQTKMEQIERLLPELIALAAQVDANEGE